MSERPVAVLDLGTNSTRFLMVDGDAGGFSTDHVLDRDSVVTRLGEGVDEQGRLGDSAIERVVDRVNQYDERIDRRNGQWRGAVATSACRRVDNGKDFLDQVQSILDVRPDVVTGDREAELIFKGVNASLPEISSGQIIDIGGGSTEWIVFENGKTVRRDSRSIGVVTLRERCDVDGQWTEDDVVHARQLVHEQLPEDKGEGPLIVVGGTGTTLSAHRQNLREYQPGAVHGDRIPLDEVEAIRREFQSLTFDEMEGVRMVQPGREDVMVPGIVILESFASLAGSSEVVVSDYGILAGLIEEVLAVEPTH